MKVENKWPNEKLPRTDETRGNILLSRANESNLRVTRTTVRLIHLGTAPIHSGMAFPLDDHYLYGTFSTLNMIVVASDQNSS
jgi:hypothetical protein